MTTTAVLHSERHTAALPTPVPAALPAAEPAAIPVTLGFHEPVADQGRDADTLPGHSGLPAEIAGDLDVIAGAIARLRDTPWWRFGDDEVLATAVRVEQVLRSGFGVQVRVAGEIAERALAEKVGEPSPAHLLARMLTIPAGQARARLAAARIGLGIESVTGQSIPPVMPELIAVIDTGAISDEHAAVITTGLAAIPPAVDDETRHLCHDLLVTEAARRDPVALRAVAEQIRLICNPDGTGPGTDPIDRAELHIGTFRHDSLTPIRGLLDPLTAEHLRVAINALAAPRPLDEHTPDPRPAPLRRAHALTEILVRYTTSCVTSADQAACGRHGNARNYDKHAGRIYDESVGISPSGDTVPDPSSGTLPSPSSGAAPSPPADSARADRKTPGRPAGGDREPLDGRPSRLAGCTCGRADKTPGSGPAGYPQIAGSGPRPVVAVTIDANSLTRTSDTSASHGIGPPTRARPGRFDYGGPVSIATAHMLACDGIILTQIIGDDGAILDQGRGTRLFTRAQRRALTTRDRGCAFPGCDIPAGWCEAHHITYWSHGGRTDLANGVLLCRYHHAVIHQEHWHIQPATTPGGRPAFIPPRHIDLKQQPRYNTHFHLLH